MKNNIKSNKFQKNKTMLRPYLMIAFMILYYGSEALTQPTVSHYIYGQIFNVQQTTDAVESESTSALPGVIIDDPEPANEPFPPVPLPGVTIEAFSVTSNALLGTGKANQEGFYNLSYMHLAETHQVNFLIFLDFADGSREFVGTVDTTSTGDSIAVDTRLFNYDIEVVSEDAVGAGKATFSADDQFLFTEIGDIDMDDIYDEQRDPGDGSKWGLTKATAVAGPRSMGPDFGFGGRIELYGLFGETAGARYYKINYTGPETGSITTPLYKKNYVVTSTGLEVYKTKVGPFEVLKGRDTLKDVYVLDEFLVGEEMIPEHPGKFFSPYWTELGLRGVWNTADLTDGKYTLSVESWDALGDSLLVPAPTNDFATLNLHLVNTPPKSKIHNFQYLSGDIVLSAADPCQRIVLNKLSSPTFDDNLQFQITARHTTPSFLAGFLRDYNLQAWYGNNTHEWSTGWLTTPIREGIIQTPPGEDYQSCGYRFRLRVRPKITDGYFNIYIRDDNWYAGITVLE